MNLAQSTKLLIVLLLLDPPKGRNSNEKQNTNNLYERLMV
jgi:hypothetical protein